MSCYVSRQCDEHARSLSHDHETVGEQVIDDYGWERIGELAKALGMSEDDITDALVEHRMSGARMAA